MKIKSIEVFVIKVPFKIKFQHSSKSRTESENIIVKINSNNYYGLGEGLPRKYVTGETIKSVLKVLNNKIIPDFKEKIFKSFEEVVKEIKKYLKKIKKEELTAFSCFEQALINLAAQEFNKKMLDLLNILKIEHSYKRHEFKYSAVLGDENILNKLLKSIYFKFRNFDNLKVKISKNSFKDLNIIRNILPNTEIRVDANEDFDSKNIEKLFEFLQKNKIKYIEQPFKVEDRNKREIFELAKKYEIKIIIDEDLCIFEDLKKVIDKNQKISDMPNIRISKNGGIVNSLLLYKETKQNNFDSILACMVGETILSRYNIILSYYLDFKFHEGDYDKYLLKNSFLYTQEFEKNGTFKYLKYDLNSRIRISDNFNNLVLKKFYY